MVIFDWSMASNPKLLCIHRDPEQLSLLRNNGYDVLTATNGHDGLRLFMTRPVDAIVLEYHLGFLDGGMVASEIKKVQPLIPILMVIDHLEVPDGALRAVDMVVAKYDGDRFLLAAVQSVLAERPVLKSKPKRRGRMQPSPLEGSGANDSQPQQTVHNPNSPFSPAEWQSILKGTVKFGSDA